MCSRILRAEEENKFVTPPRQVMRRCPSKTSPSEASVPSAGKGKMKGKMQLLKGKGKGKLEGKGKGKGKLEGKGKGKPEGKTTGLSRAKPLEDSEQTERYPQKKKPVLRKPPTEDFGEAPPSSGKKKLKRRLRKPADTEDGPSPKRKKGGSTDLPETKPTPGTLALTDVKPERKKKKTGEASEKPAVDGGAETKAKPLTLENPKKKATAEVREAAELYYPEDPEERRKLKGAAAESKEQLKHRQTKLNELRNVISTPREYHYTSSIETTTERAQSVIGDFWTVQEPGRSKTSNRKSEGKGEEEGSKGKKKGGGKGKGKTEETTTGGAHVQKSYSYPCQCQIPFSIIEMVTV